MPINKISVPFELKSFDEEKGIFEGYASVFSNVDSGNDRMMKGAFSKSIEVKGPAGENRVKILAMHNSDQLPIGKPLTLKEDERGLFVRAQISDTALGKDVKTLIKDKVFTELSIGYIAKKYTFDAKNVRNLHEVDLLEISPVIWAMNSAATINGYKSLGSKGHQYKGLTDTEAKSVEQKATELLASFGIKLDSLSIDGESKTVSFTPQTIEQKEIPFEVFESKQADVTSVLDQLKNLVKAPAVETEPVTELVLGEKQFSLAQQMNYEALESMLYDVFRALRRTMEVTLVTDSSTEEKMNIIRQALTQFASFVAEAFAELISMNTAEQPMEQVIMSLGKAAAVVDGMSFKDLPKKEFDEIKDMVNKISQKLEPQEPDVKNDTTVLLNTISNISNMFKKED